MSRFSLTVLAVFSAVGLACESPAAAGRPGARPLTRIRPPRPAAPPTSAPTPAKRPDASGTAQASTTGVRRAGEASPHAAAKPALPGDLPYRRIIDPNRIVPGSLSIGSTSHGRLLRAASLPLVSPHVRIAAQCAKRKTNFATQELVALLQYAGKQVAARHPGGRLMVCNMSQRGGGDIRWSKSHNSGRDADLLFYVKRWRRGPKGPRLVPTELTHMVRVGQNLRSPAGTFHFDVARNWALVAALLSHPRIQVQWLFISRPLRKALLDHAVRHGAPAAIIDRARLVLRQPTFALPHNDHLHLRVYCSEREVLEGCGNYPPFWPGVRTHRAALDARIRALLPGLRDPDANVRAAVLGWLGALGGRAAAGEVARRLIGDPVPTVRQAALGWLGRWRRATEPVTERLVRFVRAPGAGIARGDETFATGAALSAAERGARDLVLAYRAIGRLASDATVKLLQAALRSRRVIASPPATSGKAGVLATSSAAVAATARPAGPPEALLAARASLAQLDPRLVPALIDALDHDDARVRETAARALRRTTNHTLRVRWARADKFGERVRRRGRAKWRAFWRARATSDRAALLLAGFQRARLLRGVKHLLRWDTLRRLIPLTKRRDHLGYNAQRVLSRITGHHPGWPGRSAWQRYKRWRIWWNHNGPRVRRTRKLPTTL